MAEAIIAELCGAVYLAKKEMLGRAVEEGVTGIALERLIRGLSDIKHAEGFFARLSCPAPIYLRTWQEAEQLLTARPDLDAHNCNSPGTYLIVVVYRHAKGKKAAATYVGCAYDKTIAERTREHDARFERLQRAEEEGDKHKVDAYSDGQRGLYRRNTIARESLCDIKGCRVRVIPAHPPPPPLAP